MKRELLLAVIAAAGLSTSACHAQSSMRTVEQQTVNGKYSASHIELLKSGQHLETVTCQDYNLLDETYRPQAVTYAANYGPKGKAHPVVTVTGVENVVPVVGASCHERPGDHFLSAVHRAMTQAN